MITSGSSLMEFNAMTQPPGAMQGPTFVDAVVELIDVKTNRATNCSVLADNSTESRLVVQLPSFKDVCEENRT